MSHLHRVLSCSVLLALGVHCTTASSDPGRGTDGLSPGVAGRAGSGGARSGGITGTAGTGGAIGTGGTGGGGVVGTGGIGGINGTAQTGGITGSRGNQSRADAGADATSPGVDGAAPATCGTRTTLRGKTSRTVM